MCVRVGPIDRVRTAGRALVVSAAGRCTINGGFTKAVAARAISRSASWSHHNARDRLCGVYLVRSTKSTSCQQLLDRQSNRKISGHHTYDVAACMVPCYLLQVTEYATGLLFACARQPIDHVYRGRAAISPAGPSPARPNAYSCMTTSSRPARSDSICLVILMEHL